MRTTGSPTRKANTDLCFEVCACGVGIVCCELGKHGIWCCQQTRRADLKTQISVGFASEHRVVPQPLLLGMLDLRVPVGAFDQTHHELPSSVSGECNQPVGHGRCALLIGLEDEAEPVPGGKLRLAGK